MIADLRLVAGRLHVRTPYAPALVERFRAIPGRAWVPETKEWTFPVAPDVVSMLVDVLGILPWSLPKEVREAVERSMPVAAKQRPVDTAILNGHVFKTEPFDHQRRNLARLMVEDRWLLADDMGTGKSHAIANRVKALAEYWDGLCDEKNPEPRTLIVCPKSVVPGWVDQLSRHADIDAEMVVGNRHERETALRNGLPTKVTNYESLIHTGDAFENVSWDVVVADEIQRIKNHSAQTSKAFRKLAEKARYVWGLSGTPFPNGLEDALGVMAAIKPDLLPVHTKSAFDARYCVKQAIGKDADGNPAPPFKTVAYRNVAELHGYIAQVTSRVTKEECLDLPPKVYSVRSCRLEGEQARVYRDVKKDAVARIKTLRGEGVLTVQNILSEGLRLLQIVGGHLPLLIDSEDDLPAQSVHRFDKPAKLGPLAELIEEVGSRQVVLWACFRPEVAMLRDWLDKNFGGGVSVLIGGMSTKDRQENIDAFTRGDNRWFVGTAEAGGVGVNGLQVCSTMVYYSRGFRLDSYLQSQDRCHRIGSVGESVSIVKIMADGTIDFKVDEALDRKQSLQDLMLSKPEDMF